jgi:hypothetical protein
MSWRVGEISAWTFLLGLVKLLRMSAGKNSHFPHVVCLAMLAAACVLRIGVLSAKAQKLNTVSNASNTNAASESNVEVLPTVTVTASGLAHDPRADKAWQELERAEKDVPNLPIAFCWKLEFQTVHPEDVGKFLDKRWIPDEIEKADKARDFYTRFPRYSKVWDARAWEYENLAKACSFMGSWDEAEANLRQSGLYAEPQLWSGKNLAPRLMTLEKLLLENTNLLSSSRFLFRGCWVDRLATGPEQDWLAAAQELRRDFPQEEQSYSNSLSR